MAPIADLCRIGDRMETVFHESCHEVLDAVVHFGNTRLAEGATDSERNTLLRMAEVTGDFVAVYDPWRFLGPGGATETEQHEQSENSQQHDRAPFVVKTISTFYSYYTIYIVLCHLQEKQEDKRKDKPPKEILLWCK